MKLFRVFLSLTFITVFPLFIHAQIDSLEQMRVEQLLITQRFDSARIYTEDWDLNQASDYQKSLRELAVNEELDYEPFHSFVTKMSTRAYIQTSSLDSFIQSKLKVPSSKESINIDWIDIQFYYTQSFRNSANLKQANIENEKILNYLNQFDESDEGYTHGIIKYNIHQIVSALIQKDIEKGKLLCEENTQRAIGIKDTNLIIACQYHLCDFIMLEGDLQGYIDISRKCFEMDQAMKSKSQYFHANVIHLVDALIYAGDPDGDVLDLLDILYNHPRIRPDSYTLYAKYVARFPPGSPEVNNLLEKMGHSSLEEFADESFKISKKAHNLNDQYHMVQELSRLLIAHGSIEKGIYFKDLSIQLTQEMYGEEMSKALSENEINQVRIEKEHEVALEKQKANLYSIIAALIAGLLLLTIWLFVRQQKQNRLLRSKNEEISQQKDAIAKREEEKALLLKEVHHRVKNNFQMVSSLLELQSRGIEDDRARELAEEGKNRVKSMALIHQRLYQNDDLLIYFDEYINKLVTEIAAMYDHEHKAQVKVDIPSISFDIDTAIPLGLIVNELVTNAFKYGMTEDSKNLEVRIEKHSNDSYLLKVKDSGKGLSKNFDPQKAKSLGLRLVRSLSKQLQGSVQYTYEAGSAFKVLFKDSDMRRQVQ
ncbi:sensor histidine kinase [bacterium SCSIO 12741]|nr:sensor histidine kinase [bacterium SCSIO 12741]